MINKTNSQIILYATPDGRTKIEVKLEEETVWLTLNQLAELFQRDKSVISRHIKNIFETKELESKSVVANFATTATDGKTYQVDYYNLDLIISVGYRVNSIRGTQFRIWATQRLKEYLIKGFTLDDERLKGQNNQYFEELLERIREIRASERNFYQKVTDIYLTSIDYQKDAALTKKFFATVQNKMHFAIHGQTAAEVIVSRADSQKPNMGLSCFKGLRVMAGDVDIAKNYLSLEEIRQLNLLVSLFLDFAELQAVKARPMKMKDWITKLDEFLKLSEMKVLESLGRVSAEEAERVARKEYEKYRKDWDKNYLSDFDREVKKLLKESDKK